jgi:hypothetical protein
MSITESFSQSVSEDKYPSLSRSIDILAFILLLAALFMPLVRLGFRTMQFVDTDALPIVAGAALIGLLAAFGRYRRIAVASALVYGGTLLIFVMNFYDKMAAMQNVLKVNPFAVLVTGLIGLTWGCAVITICILAVLCSGVFVRQMRQT